MMMPVMGGCEATQAIRNTISKEKQPVIIALTANAFQEGREECLQSGMDEVLTKPGILFLFLFNFLSHSLFFFSSIRTIEQYPQESSLSIPAFEMNRCMSINLIHVFLVIDILQITQRFL